MSSGSFKNPARPQKGDSRLRFWFNRVQGFDHRRKRRKRRAGCFHDGRRNERKTALKSTALRGGQPAMPQNFGVRWQGGEGGAAPPLETLGAPYDLKSGVAIRPATLPYSAAALHSLRSLRVLLLADPGKWYRRLPPDHIPFSTTIGVFRAASSVAVRLTQRVAGS